MFIYVMKFGSDLSHELLKPSYLNSKIFPKALVPYIIINKY